MGSVFGKNIKLSLFGESHGEAIGCVIDGFPHGIKIDFDFIESEMERRRAKNPSISTARNEKDKVEILSGFLENKTTGMPIAAIIRNENKRSGDYSNLKIMPRPSHSDFTAMIRYQNYNDIRGGGERVFENPYNIDIIPALGLIANSDIISIYLEPSLGLKINSDNNKNINYSLGYGVYGEVYITPIKNLELYLEMELGNGDNNTDNYLKFNASTGITWYLS